MKTSVRWILAAMCGLPAVLCAQSGLFPGQADRANGRVTRSAIGGDTLLARQDANGILEGFKVVYKAAPGPRVLIYVNRTAAEPGAAALPEPSPAAFSATLATPPATGLQAAATPSLATPPVPASPATATQTADEVERLFRRAFGNAGVKLVFPEVLDTIAAQPAGCRLNEAEAAPRRQALTPLTDLVVEIVISRRPLPTFEYVPDAVAVPDLEAVAIRLKDNAIVGRASARALLERNRQAAVGAGPLTLHDAAEATALALMQAMTAGMK